MRKTTTRKGATWILPRRATKAICVFFSVLFLFYCDGFFGMMASAKGSTAIAAPKGLVPPGLPADAASSLPTIPPAPSPRPQAVDWEPGDVVVGVNHSQYKVYSKAGVYKETLNDGLDDGTDPSYTTGMAFDRDFDLWTTNFSKSIVNRLSREHPHQVLQRIDIADPGGGNCESVTFAENGDLFVASPFPAKTTGRLLRFTPGGLLLRSYEPDVEVTPGPRYTQVDWIDLSRDQKTLFYTSEGKRVLRYDVEAGRWRPSTR